MGCGQGGKLGHGNKNSEGVPQLIAHFEGIDARPVSISAGAWHAAVLSSDGRVLTWGWGFHGCLGHGYAEECATLPMPVETSNAVYVSAGQYSTFVMTDNGDVYSFGWKGSYNLGLQVR